MSIRESKRKNFPPCSLGALACVMLLPCLALASPPLPNESIKIETLPSAAGQHWVWVNDIAFSSMPDGRATLVDGDAGTMLGMLSTGYAFGHVVIPRHRDVIYSPEAYYSRGTRGVRTDVVTLYDARHLSPIGEIPIPPKRAAIVPRISSAQLTDDDRFLLIYDYTPAQSVTVVDTRTQRFAGEIATPGCGLVYPTAARSFFSICADGALLEVDLDDHGRAARLRRTPELFDPEKDPLTEDAVRSGSTWWFTSYQGWAYALEHTAQGTRVAQRWSLFSPSERAAHWRTGGLQYLAVHRRSARLYAIVHQGDLASHKEPGKEVWVFDLATHRRVQSIALRSVATSILVTQDPQPLLFTCFGGSGDLEVYDARTGQYLRTVTSVAETPTIMVSP